MPQTIFRILSRVSLVASLAAAALVFMLDRRAPLGLTIGALYVFPLLLSLLADRRRNTLGVAWLCSVLVVVGYWYSPDVGVPGWIVAWDRAITVLAIWITTLLGLEVTSAKRQIRDLGKLLVMCAWTKQVKVDGEWMSVERYLTECCGVTLTHGISKDAADRLRREEGLEVR